VKKLLLILSLIVFIFHSYNLYKVTVNYAQTDRFADENDHMIGGYFLIHGKQLYKDISVVHQPLNYYFSSLGQKIFKANSIFTFVNRQRLMILAYSLFFNILYLFIFGPGVIIFTLIFEITKFWFLGNLLLGESLAVYPMIFLFGIVVKKLLLGKELKKYELILFSVATFTGVFLLLQMWPTIFLLNIALLFFYRKNIKDISYLVLPAILLTAILFIFVPFKYYIQEVFTYNFKYYLPYMDKVNSFLGYVKMIFLPFTSFHNNPNPMEVLTIVFIFIYIFYLFIFIRNKKTFLFLFVLFCLVSLNNRESQIKFTNFHLLPWLGVYLFIPIVLLPIFKKKIKNVSPHLKSFITLTLVFTVIYVNFVAATPFKVKKNVMTENDINFHDINKYGLAIKAIDKSGDRLIAFPSDNLIHWVSETDLATRQIEYYGWQFSIPEDKARFINVFKNHPAEFVVNGDPFNSLPYFVKLYLDEKYVQINSLGTPTRLFILKSILPKITEKQWANFKYLLFDRPENTTY